VVFNYRQSAGETRRLAGELREAGGETSGPSRRTWAIPLETPELESLSQVILNSINSIRRALAKASAREKQTAQTQQLKGEPKKAKRRIRNAESFGWWTATGAAMSEA
jgi:hypothetical protein